MHVKELSIIKLSYIKAFAFRDCTLETIINILAYSKIIVTIKKMQQNQFSKWMAAASNFKQQNVNFSGKDRHITEQNYD